MKNPWKSYSTTQKDNNPCLIRENQWLIKNRAKKTQCCRIVVRISTDKNDVSYVVFGFTYFLISVHLCKSVAKIFTANSLSKIYSYEKQNQNDLF